MSVASFSRWWIRSDAVLQEHSSSLAPTANYHQSVGLIKVWLSSLCSCGYAEKGIGRGPIWDHTVSVRGRRCEIGLLAVINLWPWDPKHLQLLASRKLTRGKGKNGTAGRPLWQTLSLGGRSPMRSTWDCMCRLKLDEKCSTPKAHLSRRHREQNISICEWVLQLLGLCCVGKWVPLGAELQVQNRDALPRKGNNGRRQRPLALHAKCPPPAAPIVNLKKGCALLIHDTHLHINGPPFHGKWTYARCGS